MCRKKEKKKIGTFRLIITRKKKKTRNFSYEFAVCKLNLLSNSSEWTTPLTYNYVTLVSSSSRWHYFDHISLTVATIHFYAVYYDPHTSYTAAFLCFIVVWCDEHATDGDCRMHDSRADNTHLSPEISFNYAPLCVMSFRIISRVWLNNWIIRLKIFIYIRIYF